MATHDEARLLNLRVAAAIQDLQRVGRAMPTLADDDAWLAEAESVLVRLAELARTAPEATVCADCGDPFAEDGRMPVPAANQTAVCHIGPCYGRFVRREAPSTERDMGAEGKPAWSEDGAD